MSSSLASAPRPDDDDLQARVAVLERQVAALSPREGLTLLVFSGELDRLLAAFNLAVAAAACGLPVSMFFTFWGSAALRQRTLGGQRGLVERLFALLLRGGLRHRALSRFDFLGLGRVLLRREMRHKNVSSLDDLVARAGTLGVTIHVCEMSLDLMGIRREELLDYPHLETCGAARFLVLARGSATTLFV